MFDVRVEPDGEISLVGRFDAAQVEKAQAVFDSIQESRVINFRQLDYISSAGLGLLLKTQKRLKDMGERLRLKHLNPHIRDVFRYAGFDAIFEILDE